MQLFQKLKTSSLIHNITKYIIVCVLACLLATSLACYFIVWPQLRETSIDKAQNTTTEICQQIDNYITTLSNTSLFIADSNELKNAFDNYKKDDSNQNYQRICLVLHDLCAKMPNIRSVFVTTEAGTSFNTITNIQDMDYASADELASTSSPARFSPIYLLDSSTETYSLCYLYRRSIQNVPCLFFFFYKVNSIINTTTTLSQNVFDSYALYDSSKIFYIVNEDNFPADYLQTIEDSNYPAIQSQNSGYYFTDSTNNYSWHFTAYASTKTLTATVINIFVLVLLFSVVFSITILFLVIKVISHFIAPLNGLS